MPSVTLGSGTRLPDLRLMVRGRPKGDRKSQAPNGLVARCGDFVLLRPPFDAETALLWAMPVLVLGAGGVGVWFGRRRGAKPGVVAPLSGDEQARVDELVG